MEPAALNTGMVSYALGFVAFLTLTLVLLTGWRGRLQGGLLVTAAGVTAFWAAVHVSWTGWGQPAAGVVQAVETLHFVVWFAFLLGLLRDAQKHMQVATVLIYILSAAVFLAPLFESGDGGLGVVAALLFRVAADVVHSVTFEELQALLGGGPALAAEHHLDGLQFPGGGGGLGILRAGDAGGKACSGGGEEIATSHIGVESITAAGL